MLIFQGWRGYRILDTFLPSSGQERALEHCQRTAHLLDFQLNSRRIYQSMRFDGIIVFFLSSLTLFQACPLSSAHSKAASTSLRRMTFMDTWAFLLERVTKKFRPCSAIELFSSSFYPFCSSTLLFCGFRLTGSDLDEESFTENIMSMKILQCLFECEYLCK